MKKIKQLDILKKLRKLWKINPRTRIKKSAKIYNRSKAKNNLRKRLKEEDK
jgi:hypothetical protein